MRRDWPRNAGSRAGSPAGILNGIRRDRLPGLPAREQPLFWPCGFPVIAENVQQPGRKHNVTIFSPLARLHTDDHPLAVDSGWLEPDRLGNTQSRRVAGGQNHPLFRAFHRTQESRNLRGAQHFGKLVRLPAGRDVILDGPFPAGQRVLDVGQYLGGNCIYCLVACPDTPEFARLLYNGVFAGAQQDLPDINTRIMSDAGALGRWPLLTRGLGGRVSSPSPVR